MLMTAELRTRRRNNHGFRHWRHTCPADGQHLWRQDEVSSSVLAMSYVTVGYRLILRTAATWTMGFA